ncbi:MAG: hypothetical protein IJW25_02060, partial [Clostridia bacterium]|nr:hypothetical protein [Clostridia bacterium]
MATMNVGTITSYGAKNFKTAPSQDFINTLSFGKETQDSNQNVTPAASLPVGIISAGIVKVGGLIGTLTSGDVSTCYTDNNCEIVGGIEQLSISGGDYFATEESYVGGIVGFACGGTIFDCENNATITAMAVWNKLDGTDYKYDNSDENSLYVYQKMESKAYAGGIVPNYLTDSNIDADNEDENNGSEIVATRLKNTGTVSGGYSGYKPVVRLSPNDGWTANEWLSLGYGGLSLATGIAGAILIRTAQSMAIKMAGQLITSTFVKAFSGPIGWALLAVDIVWTLSQLYQAKEELEAQANNIKLYATPYYGNSEMVTTGLIGEASTQDEDGNYSTFTSWGVFNTKDEDLKREFPGPDILTGDDWDEISAVNRRKFSGNALCSGIDEITILEVNAYTNYPKEMDRSDYNFSAEIYYDGISPTIRAKKVDYPEGTFETKTLNVTNSVKNYDQVKVSNSRYGSNFEDGPEVRDGKSLHTGNPVNANYVYYDYFYGEEQKVSAYPVGLV